MRNFFNFLQYHNAVPIALGILILGGGGAFAATDPQAIYSQTQKIVSVDNSYLVNKDLGAYSPQVRINTVTEDADNYYVDYTLKTIDVQTYAWQDVVKEETMTVSKIDLGQYRDLGVYVTQQLRQIVDREKQRLAETQDIEKRKVTPAVVATIYGGLVGQFLDDTTETLPGYTPVVTAPSQSIAGSFSGPAEAAAAAGASEGSTGAAGGSGVQVGLQVLGNNPAHIALGDSYVDLGVALIDPLQTNVGVHTFLDGVETVSPSIDTSTTTSYTIEYRVTDLLGNSILARRIVLVGGATDPGTEINESGNVTPAAPPTAPQDIPPAAATPAAPADTATSSATTPASSTTDASSTTTTTTTDTTTSTATPTTDAQVAAPATASTTPTDSASPPSSTGTVQATTTGASPAAASATTASSTPSDASSTPVQ